MGALCDLAPLGSGLRPYQIALALLVSEYFENMNIKQITERVYNDALGVLPPAAIGPHGFLIGEPMNHNSAGEPLYTAYLYDGNHYMTDPMTIADFEALEGIDTSDAEPANEAIELELELIESYGQGPVDAFISLFRVEDLEHFEEAYTGQYDSNRDFAQDMADQIGAVPDDLTWPVSCIDWEKAARELMYDYCEEDGFYFSNNW